SEDCAASCQAGLKTRATSCQAGLKTCATPSSRDAHRSEDAVEDTPIVVELATRRNANRIEHSTAAQIGRHQLNGLRLARHLVAIRYGRTEAGVPVDRDSLVPRWPAHVGIALRECVDELLSRCLQVV